MSKRALLLCGLFGALSGSCSSSSPSSGASPAAGSLAGTWNLMTTPVGESAIATTVTVGQDSLAITSPDFTLTATRTGDVLSFEDDAPGPDNAAVLAATQTVGAFDTGIIPFNLGGSWAITVGSKGESPGVTCTLGVTATEIDGACQYVSPSGPWFAFTTKKMTSAASSFGDFGGEWLNTWTWSGPGGGTFPCTLDFTDKGITTCAGGAVDGQVTGSPLAGITFTYDGADTVSGAAQGWAEFSATR